MTPKGLLLVSFVVVALAIPGCKYQDRVGPSPSEPTLIDDLRDFCQSGPNVCEGYSVDLLLYLDTVNLPSNNKGQPWLVLSSLPTTPIADGNDRLGFEFVGTLVPGIDPGIIDQTGWKLHVPDARIKYCETCYTNQGLVPKIYLTGSLDDVEFMRDPTDTLEIYINISQTP